MKLHLGSGKHKFEDHINIDKISSADLVLDLEKDLLPYENDSVQQIQAIDFLEHIHNLIPLMNECWRVLAPSGIFYIEVPRYPSLDAFNDPTHVRFFTEGTFNYFTEYEAMWELYGIKPWKEKLKELKDNRIFITIMPRK